MKEANKKCRNNKKEAGFSLVESLPLIIVMSSLLGFLLGLWGLTHRYILNSIASRNYAFETFNNRANLTYFNDNRSETNSYEQSEMRFHASGDGDGGSLKAHTTPVRFPAYENVNEPADQHRVRIWNDAVIPAAGEAEIDIGTRQPWILSAYGICLNANCGD